MLLKNIEPFARNVIVTSLTPDTKGDVYTELRTPDCRLFYFINGGGSMVIEGKPYALHAGCAILFKAGTKYIWQPDQNGVLCISINFDYTMNFSNLTSSFHPVHSSVFSESTILEQIEFEDATTLNAPVYIKNARFLESNVRLLSSEFYLKHNYSSELLSSCLKLILISLAKNADMTETSDKSKNYETVQKVIHYIESNYHLHLSNESMGKHFHFNPSYLNRIFKQHTGDTIHNFLIKYRMNLAMELLHTTNIPVNEIVATVGFTDVPHFIKSFKKITGKTPGEYRNPIYKADSI